MLCLATLLLQPNLPKLMAIDEPELGLYPRAINLLADMLTTASKQSQIIVSTQSVDLVDQFTPEEIIVVEREETGIPTFKHLQSDVLDEWLEEYSLGELEKKAFLEGSF